MTIALQAFGQDAAGWLHMGMANRLATDMGLNLDAASLRHSNYPSTNVESNTQALSLEEETMRRQIYWSLYCHDKLYASYTGRVCSMSVSYTGQPPSIPGLFKTVSYTYEYQDYQASVEQIEVVEDDCAENPQTNPPSPPVRYPSSTLSLLQRSLSSHCQILEKIMGNLYVWL